MLGVMFYIVMLSIFYAKCLYWRVLCFSLFCTVSLCWVMFMPINMFILLWWASFMLSVTFDNIVLLSVGFPKCHGFILILSVVILSIVYAQHNIIYCYAKCHYAECRFSQMLWVFLVCQGWVLNQHLFISVSFILSHFTVKLQWLLIFFLIML